MNLLHDYKKEVKSHLIDSKITSLLVEFRAENLIDCFNSAVSMEDRTVIFFLLAKLKMVDDEGEDVLI